MQLNVAIIGAAHGLKGEVRLDVRTDQPERRFMVGTAIETDPADFGPLTVKRTREYKGATYVLFEECTDRTQAENLRGVKLVVETDEDEYVEEDAFYEHELVGLEVLDTEGYTLGEITGLEHFPAQDILVVREVDGNIARVPFVRDIVIEVDLDDNCVVVDAPFGLFASDALDDEASDSADIKADNDASVEVDGVEDEKTETNGEGAETDNAKANDDADIKADRAEESTTAKQKNTSGHTSTSPTDRTLP